MDAAELASRAGVDLEEVERLAALGILNPDPEGRFSLGALRATRLIQSLVRAGIPREGIGEAVRDGTLSFGFLDQAVYERFSGLSSTSFRELSKASGVGVDLLMVVREANGFLRADPDDLVRDDELEIVPLLRCALAWRLDPSVLERLLRVYGESLRRAVETEADAYMNQVVVPLLDTGMSEAEAIEAASRFGEEAAPLVDRAILGLYHAQQEHAWTRSLVERVETALEEAGLASRLRRPPAVCFLDLSGFTRLTEERGDQAAARTAAELARIVQRTSAEHRGTPVKWLGDGVMSYFDVPGDAVVAALEMRELVSGAGLPPAHVGLDAGPVIFQDGDYFGRTVNAAARIAAYAHADEVLVSERVLEAGCMEGVSFEPLGPIALKGVAEPVTLHRASRAANVG